MGQTTEQILSQVANSGWSEGDSGSQSVHVLSGLEQGEWNPNRSLNTNPRFQDSPCIHPSEDNQITLPSEGINEHRVKVAVKCRQSRTKDWSYWTSIPAVGTFRVQYGTLRVGSGRFWTIQIDFWPSIKFNLKKFISLRYTNRCNSEGFMPLFPSVAVYPILSRNDPIWDMIGCNRPRGDQSSFPGEHEWTS